jgi:hypothetical protein
VADGADFWQAVTPPVPEWRAGSGSPPSALQWHGLTLVHFSAQHKRFLWCMRCVQELFLGVFLGLQGLSRGCQGVVSGVFVSETAQVELRSDECKTLCRGCASTCAPTVPAAATAAGVHTCPLPSST